MPESADLRSHPNVVKIRRGQEEGDLVDAEMLPCVRRTDFRDPLCHTKRVLGVMQGKVARGGTAFTEDCVSMVEKRHQIGSRPRPVGCVHLAHPLPQSAFLPTHPWEVLRDCR